MDETPCTWMDTFLQNQDKKEDRISPNWRLDPPYLKTTLNS
jgi:hypothetical protein